MSRLPVWCVWVGILLDPRDSDTLLTELVCWLCPEAMASWPVECKIHKHIYTHFLLVLKDREKRSMVDNECYLLLLKSTWPVFTVTPPAADNILICIHVYWYGWEWEHCMNWQTCTYAWEHTHYSEVFIYLFTKIFFIITSFKSFQIYF